MTHDQRLQAHTVYESAMILTSKTTCPHCGAFVGMRASPNVKERLDGWAYSNLNLTARLLLHEKSCSLRIVIEAALANTEKQPAWMTELVRQWPRIINGTEQMICWTGELEAYTPASPGDVQEIIDGCLAARKVEECSIEALNTESEGA